MRIQRFIPMVLACVVGFLTFLAVPALAAAPEAPKTESPTGVTTVTATLHGMVNPIVEARVHWSFAYAPEEYGPECVDGFRTTEKEAEKAAVGESVEITELEPHRKYMFCLTVRNEEGETRGNEVSFETEALAPTVSGQSVIGVTSSTARVEGLVNAENESTACTIQYGIASVSEQETPCEPGTVEGYYQQPVGVSITTLEANKTYKYRILAKNATGEAEGAGEFTTPPEPPLASTGEASSIEPTTATIYGTVNPNATGIPAQDDTKYYFQYGTTISYGHQVPGLLDQTEAEACKIDHEKGEACPSESEAGEGQAAKAEQSNLVGLEPGTTYHYRIVATNDEGRQTGYGEDETFTTPATPPVFSGVSAQGVTQTGATITATLETQNLPTRWELQLGSTPGLLQPVGSGTASTTTSLNVSVGSLNPSTTYYYRLTAINSNNPIDPKTNQPAPVETPEDSFTTAPAPAGSTPAGLPALIPYQSIAELNAKEALEAKKLPSLTITKTLTNAQKLKKALKQCHAKKGKQRSSCEATAHKRFGPSKKKK
jgi:hypothetical protein